MFNMEALMESVTETNERAEEQNVRVVLSLALGISHEEVSYDPEDVNAILNERNWEFVEEMVGGSDGLSATLYTLLVDMDKEEVIQVAQSEIVPQVKGEGIEVSVGTAALTEEGVKNFNKENKDKLVEAIKNIKEGKSNGNENV